MGGRLTLWLVACLLCTATAGLSGRARNSSSFPVAASPDWRLEMGERVSPQESAALREEVREMVRSAASSRPRSSLTRGRQFHFTYDNYMRHAFPKDELKPMSCAGTVCGPRCPSNARLTPAARTRWAATRSRWWTRWTRSR